ncbi:phosphoenolpyruvate synthase [Desulfovibrio sulfodismutans]|uniref:Phosphoenolpyruvate synthase n=1 Tax=Desulfolutivibrio sulfodismutans TaxID=63561 RepID=A0A7K3NS34_9BACT|nr:phosphoenolpyruvate synthase [Desulfolutivibrio sulfodismutans]NDY58615.1 phosphoenolpyruvate synthase [Desulfolutivibrio sulfodismutans]QLA10836.1 phosphoenolpyruvate synthase [Desulfolutivibrio sulfodismutans DSM 3696]
MDKDTALVLWFDQITIEDVPYVGGKNASLGEMYQALTGKGVRVPNGFAVTATAYRRLLAESGAMDKIKAILADLDTSDMDNLAERGRKVRSLIRNLEFPDDLRQAIINAYRALENQYGKDADVAVRSSATAEDLPDASFAGQQETYLNIHGAEEVIEACGRCFASLFTNRAISYRVDKGFDHFSIALSIAVQKMVRSDLAASGVMFSIDTETGFTDAVYITGAYGLGENVVQGAVNPDEWYVFKPTLKKGFKPVIMKKVGEKAIKMVYTEDAKQPTKNVPVPDSDRRRLTINECEVLDLARMACIIEDHYSAKAGHHKPMDIEWAKDGMTGELYIVQARPETVHAIKDLTKLVKYVLSAPGEVAATGKSVGERIGKGAAHVIKEAHMIKDFRKGEVLVTDMTDPDWEPIMKIASAIVTNRGGRTCHAAIVSRELGIPCIVGTGHGSDAVADGEGLTVDCSQGPTGYVYRGLLDFEVKETDLASLPRPKTKITMNLASPEQAFEKSFIPNDGVGLAREEFIINSYIRVHPLALLRFGELKDIEVKRTIYDMTMGYENKADYFVDRLAEGVGMIAAAFYPKPVIVRLSDFKSNEYANLIGGAQFEPHEENPMIGWRGASRYYDKNYKEAFALECRAMKKIREDMGLTNLEIMIPFPRTVAESRQVLATMAEFGLRQGENGLRVIGMCEIPSNVILADEFLDVFDGFSIGSNDLTQLILGVDRDSELVAHVYDERNEAVKRMVKQVIEVARRKGKYIGICGQAPSDYIEFAEFLVECGIESMSLNPDTVIKTTLAVAALEKRLGVA